MMSNAHPLPGTRALLVTACRNRIPSGGFLSNGLLLACLFFARLAVAGETPYTGAGSGASHFYCSSDPAQSTIFFSSAFDVSSGADTAKVSDAFKQSLADEYAYEGDVLCFGKFKTLDAAQAGEKKRVSDLQASKKSKVVETGWAFGSPAASVSGSSSETSSAPSTNPLASPAAAVQPAASQSQSAPALSTTLAVRLVEQIDSGKPSGQPYRGVVTKAATAGNGVTIPSGSLAMITLMHGQSGWVAQLQQLTVKGQPVNVISGPATIMGSAQSTASSAVSSVTSALGGFGFGHKKPTAPSAAEAIASGQRVFLPPGTQLQFVLNGISSMSGGGFNGAGPAAQPMGTNSASMAAVSNTTAVAAGGTLKAKITEVRLGPSPNKIGGRYVVSRDGGHYAAFSMHGSRELIVVDGVEGPEFDHAGHAYTVGAINVAFNKDGTHSAYIGQSGDTLVAVVDNKQRATVEQLSKGAGLGELQGINPDLTYPPAVSNQAANQLYPILLSPSGQHYACIATDYAKNISNMVLDGVKGPDMMSIDRDQIAFVNEELVYVGITPDRMAHVVVNNKLGPEYGTVQYMHVTPDTRHYAVIATTKGGRMVIIDGKPGQLRQFEGNGIHDVVMASNGRVAFVGDTPLGGSNSHVAPTLYVDDHEISRDIRPFQTVDYVGNHLQQYAVFSPDGTKYAYSKVVPGGVAAVIDGKVWRTYDGIGLTQFSPDSKHAFSVGTRGQSFITIDGKEMPGVNRLDNFVFSPDGTRFAYEAYSQDGNHVVIDGKESPRYYNIIARSLSFSPDSKHYIYGACTNIMKCEVVQDGNVTPVPALSEFSARTLKPVYIFPPSFFSPDSNQVAYAYSKSDGTSQTVYFVNGKEMVHGTSFEFPSFSPDSKHFVVMGWNGHGYSFFADGKMGPGYQELLEANLNIARFEKPETYRFLGIKDDSVYRVTVDLASTN